MASQLILRQRIEEIEAFCPAGFAIGFHVKFTAPAFFLQSYPNAWNEYYARQGFLIADPVVNWSYSNTGAIRWSELEGMDPAGVLPQAREHGLIYGLAAGIMEGGTRSICGLCRSDREFTDTEIEHLYDHLSALHRETALAGDLAPDARAALRRLALEYEGRPTP